jgi:hypothetical protein
MRKQNNDLEKNNMFSKLKSWLYNLFHKSKNNKTLIQKIETSQIKKPSEIKPQTLFEEHRQKNERYQYLLDLQRKYKNKEKLEKDMSAEDRTDLENLFMRYYSFLIDTKKNYIKALFKLRNDLFRFKSECSFHFILTTDIFNKNVEVLLKEGTKSLGAEDKNLLDKIENVSVPTLTKLNSQLGSFAAAIAWHLKQLISYKISKTSPTVQTLINNLSQEWNKGHVPEFTTAPSKEELDKINKEYGSKTLNIKWEYDKYKDSYFYRMLTPGVEKNKEDQKRKAKLQEH